MTILSSLTLVASKPAELRVRGIDMMRQKLLDRIDDQIALAKALETGEVFQRVRIRRVRDVESHKVSEAAVHTRVRPWWATDKDGSVLLWIKYGSQAFDLQKGKSAIKVASRDELVGTLETVRDAVRAGEMDDLIVGAVASLKARFKK
ncbi:MAG: hypothetical protein JST16_08895 [Bdellovibrionales bacterium]|nr:hypothetical protein [Bdellovibrionales bacterium]